MLFSFNVPTMLYFLIYIMNDAFSRDKSKKYHFYLFFPFICQLNGCSTVRLMTAHIIESTRQNKLHNVYFLKDLVILLLLLQTYTLLITIYTSLSL